MLDHSRCTVVTSPQWEEHTCPPCPHGLEKGYVMTLDVDQGVNRRQRAMKMWALEQTTCGSVYHAEALAKREPVTDG